MASDSPSKLIGEYLLKGWTLMGETCSKDCNVPLMRSRDKSSLICVGCGVDFMKKPLLKSDEEIHATNSQVQSDSDNLLSVVDGKIKWLVSEVAASTSLEHLNVLVDTLSKFVTLRKNMV